MKKIFCLTLLLCFGQSFSQNGYWQQSVDYKIKGTLKDDQDKLEADEQLIYKNNSPDTLKELYFHLYWNAFKKGSHAFEDHKIGSTEDVQFGEIKLETISIDDLVYAIDIFESIGQIKLKKALLPGASCTIKMKFVSMVPSCISRAGKENISGTDYTFTQWYPKICRYDHMGWHTDPYFGREFAGTFGKYDVQIVCDKSYVVAGTGKLLNKSYKEKGWSASTNENLQNGLTTWNFYGENIHDFAFAVHKDWIHKQLNLDNIIFHFFYDEKNKEGWNDLITKWPKAYAICKKEFGTYPYDQFSFIQAGEGYMEYPMCTMLQSSGFDFFSTACHEFMHNYFYGMYGTDENLYHWMDEGVTCYAEERIKNVNSDIINPVSSAISNYNWIAGSSEEEPISTAANHFATDMGYYNAAYFKGQLFPELIRYLIGDSLMNIGFHKYYSKWKFKHPEPNDFVKIFEDASSMELTWFQNYWLNTTKTIDFSLDTVFFKNEEVRVRLSNLGIPMPVDVQITLNNGTSMYVHIPIDLTNNVKTEFHHPTKILKKWSCGSKSYEFKLTGIKFKDIESIKLDPFDMLPDMNLDNNVFIP